MTGKTVKEILYKKDRKLIEIAETMGISTQNMSALLKVQDIKTGVLEQIAKAADIPIAEFFGGAPVASIQGDHNTQIAGNRACNIGCPPESDVAVLKERIAHLEALVAEKERLIGILLKSK